MPWALRAASSSSPEGTRGRVSQLGTRAATCVMWRMVGYWFQKKKKILVANVPLRR